MNFVLIVWYILKTISLRNSNKFTHFYADMNLLEVLFTKLKEIYFM